MQIRSSNKEKGPVVAAVLALIALGLGSLFLSWQSIERQRRMVDEHMVLSGRGVLASFEANLTRAMRAFRQNPAMNSLFPSLARELLQEYAASEDIFMAGIFGPEGEPIITSQPLPKGFTAQLPGEAIESLEAEGFWFGWTMIDGKQALLAATQARPGLSMLCVPGGRQRGPMHEAPPVFLAVAMNAERNLLQLHQHKRSALFQTGYVFFAAVLLWSMAFAYLRRRDQASRLARLENFQAKLLDHMPDGLITLDPDGVIQAANGSALRLLCPGDACGPEAPDLVGRSWKDLPFSGLGGRAEWQQHEHNGQLLEILALPFQEPENEGTGHLVLIRDRTEIRALEEDLNEARRLAAIGSLAAGVAHEVRNPLSSLRGFAQLFADKLKGQKPLDAYAATMVQEADRLNRVVTDLLYLARPRELSPERVIVADVARELFDLMKLDLAHKGVSTSMQIDAPRLLADRDALKQALLNLAVNSLESLPETGGEISIASRLADGGVWVEVTDNGSGMSEEVRRQALEPFFTSRKDGTGLGLAIVHNIVRAHRGRVLIDSSPDAGTTVRLFFPDAPAERGQGENRNPETP